MIALLALAIAHQGAYQRSLSLEPAGAEVHVLVHASLTGDDRKEIWLRMDTKTRDSIFVERALAGVKLLAGSEAVALENIEVKVKVDGPIEVMIHAVARIPGGDVSVETAADAEPIDLVVLRGNRPVLRATRGAKSGGIQAKMGAGDRIRWTMLVERPPPL